MKVDDDGDGSLDSHLKTVYDGANAYADFDGLNSDALTERYLASLFTRVDDSGDVDWFLGDMLGSVRQVVDTDGTVLAEADYDSFGRLLTSEDSDLGRFRYTGREFEIETGIYYYRTLLSR